MIMRQDLSDKQLAFAAWFYEKRPFLNRLFAVICFGVAGVYFLLSVVNGVFYFVRFSTNRKTLLINTQNLILKEDQAYKSFPNALIIDVINVVRHKNRGADFLARLENPNPAWTVFSYNYTFSIDGVDLQQERSFALPGEHYLAGFHSSKEPFSDVKMKIENLKWRKINPFVDQERLKTFDITSENSVFVPGDKREVVDSVVTTINNKTPFGFWKGEVLAVVYKNKQPLAVGAAFFDQFKAGEERKGEIGLGVLPVFQVDEIKIIPQVNFLDDQNVFVL